MVPEEGAESIHHAIVERGSDIRVEAGTSVPKISRINFINKKYIALSQKDLTVKRSACLSLLQYDSKTHCSFCGTEV